MDKTATEERGMAHPAGGFFFRHVYLMAALGAVVVHFLFFLAFSTSLITTPHPLLPVTKKIEVNLAPANTDPGPQPLGMENAADYALEQQAGEHVDLPENVFETPLVETPGTQINADMPMDAPAFESAQVDTSLFDFNMPNVAQKPAVNRPSGSKGQSAKASRGSASGQKGGSPANSGGSGGGEVSVPRYKYTPLPPYPDKARKEAHEGTVTIAIDVDSSGNPGSVTIRNSSGFPELDEATVKHVKTAWKFHPAIIDGQPASATVVVPVVFNLKNA